MERLSLCSILLWIAISCNTEPIRPTCSTDRVIDVELTTATILGYAKDVTTDTLCIFCSLTPNIVDNKEHCRKLIVDNINDDGTFSATIDGLLPSSHYYYAISIISNDSYSWSSIEEFNTKKLPEGKVDLGLSVKWSSLNIGAESFYESGDYYAWGEITPKSSYNQNNYKWGEHTKYNCDASDPNADNKSILDAEDDVAHVKLGEEWHIPTRAECEELLDNCTILRVIEDGKIGVVFTSNINGNSIFLPGSGQKYKRDLVNYGIGYYWTSELLRQSYGTGTNNACSFGCGGNKLGQWSGSLGGALRYKGYNIRAVSNK